GQTARIYACQRARPAGVDRKAHASGNGPQQIARHGQNERAMTITRKNSLFAGSDGGGRTWATIATLLQTCKMNSVDPAAWLSQTLERIANQWSSAEIDALMPWNYRA
ncbi:transposase domain-containing protein, partial [Cereibacter changlensis]